MIVIFFDASALVKRYFPEEGSALVNRVFQQLSTTQLTCATIGLLEVVSVLVRKKNSGRLSASLFAQAMLEVNHEIIEEADFVLTTTDDTLLLSALPLIAQHNINATDAVILRTAMNLEENLQKQQSKIILFSCDKRLVRAARQESIEAFDPEVETIERLQTILTL